MLEFPQLLLIIIIIVLTVLLLVLGVQAFLVLTAFRKTVNKANFLLDEAKVGGNIAKIVGTIIAIILGKNLGKNVIDSMSKTDKKSQKTTRIQSSAKSSEVIEIDVEKPKKTIRRFFRRTKSL